MKFNLRTAGPALAQGFIGIAALILMAFAAPDAICSVVSRG
jgi:hypothetical protein